MIISQNYEINDKLIMFLRKNLIKKFLFFTKNLYQIAYHYYNLYIMIINGSHNSLLAEKVDRSELMVNG